MFWPCSRFRDGLNMPYGHADASIDIYSRNGGPRSCQKLQKCRLSGSTILQCSVQCVVTVSMHTGFTNHFNIGALMEKNLGMRGGQCPVQKYWKYLLKCIDEGSLDPSQVITHKVPLSQAPEMYKVFDEKTDNCVKVVLLPQE